MKQEEAINSIPYILAFLALIYLALPHVVEYYEAYARPWNTREEMTNADVESKNRVWEMFTETEVKTDAKLADILPGETAKPSESKTILPGVPTPKHETEPAIDKTPYLKPEEDTPKQEKANKRSMDTAVQKPVVGARPHPPPPAPKPHPPPPAPKHRDTGEPIWGPRAPKLDPNQPRPSDSGNDKHKGGVYPHIYGPDSLEPPGSKDAGGDSSNPPPFDFVPAAEFPAGPLQPSPYLNDFSKMLKT